MGISIYADSLDCGFHVDDTSSILENLSIRNLRDFKAIWDYQHQQQRRFIGNLTFAINYHFGKLDVFEYHLVNIAVHCAAALLVYRFVMLLFSTPVMRRNDLFSSRRFIAFFCGLVFVSHPLQTQAVTYIVQRFASLASLFYVASACFFLEARMSHGIRRYLFILGLCSAALLGIFTKEILLTLPFALILIEMFFFRETLAGFLSLLKSRKFLYFLIPALLFLLIVPFFFSFRLSNIFPTVESQRHLDPPLSSYTYLVTQFRVLVTYLRLLFLPVRQSVDYDFPASNSFFEAPVILSLFFLAAILAWAFHSYSRRRLASFGILWFFLALSVESGIKPLHNVIFEHRLYLPMTGFALFIVSMVFQYGWKKHGRLVIGALCLVIAAYSVLSYERNKVWKNSGVLWEDVIRKFPDKARPYYAAGYYYYNEGNMQKAVIYFTKAIEINPLYVQAHINLGSALDGLGNTEEAIKYYSIALKIDPFNIKAYNNLGLTLAKKGNFEAAIEQYRTALKYSPDYTEARKNLGIVLVNLGKLDDAIGEFSTAVVYNQYDASVYKNLGLAFSLKGEYGKAAESLKKAISLDPQYDEAHYLLGIVLYTQKKFEEALGELLIAVRLKHGNVDAHLKLSLCYNALGQPDSAKAHLDEANRLLGVPSP